MISDQLNLYQTSESDADHAIAAWSYSAQSSCVSRVVPDGCCDIIIFVGSYSQSASWFVSDLSSSVYSVVSDAGDEMKGIRLQPGTQLDQLAMSRWMESHHLDELFVSNQIDEFCERSTSLSEALQCLSSKEVNNVQAAANNLGVSPRTLQRIIKRGTQRSPYFWLSLARMRRTAKSLNKFDSLADVATAFHFSDQAHMTREMKLWLGLAPSQIKTDTELLSLLSEPGYV